jgi:hypothetical protein
MASSIDDRQLIALVDEIDAIEVRIEALRPSVTGIAGRVATYFGVLIALTVGLVDSAYMFPWMAAALVTACIPDVRRLMKSRALARERDRLIQRGTGHPSGTDDVL